MQNLFFLSSSDDSIASDHTAILILLAIELTYKTEIIFWSLLISSRVVFYPF